ncbi:regulator of G-protein signaling 21-like [Anarrhichthys ocellatus]|uniref:regulator of G-protein signaling 21-like n=1 Tax=Anarrhichthys ocellatus TaxID=433405 RepID=UPI0012EE35CA|nr:regulator of G-protein signaling 21-like [Anarrhichthys ocellatus]
MAYLSSVLTRPAPVKCPVEDLQIKTEKREIGGQPSLPCKDVWVHVEETDPNNMLRKYRARAGQLVFEDFLRTEYSEENLLFWLACENYKKITRVTEMTVAAKKIYAEFVQVDAPRQINIDCVTREEIMENLSQPEPNCFDRAQRLIYSLMENDCYPRFLKSEMYQVLLEQA